jgi:hypothetical protein
MPKSLRIRTEVGKDRNLTFNLDQDFEFIEILSIKLSQEDLYVRQCADYGVVVGRISINDGFGVPNAKLSIFIPISDEDELDPIISTLYPYKNVSDVNEDGYKYNLLPYKPSYPGHAPTGTFPDLSDALTNPVVVEIYDKYYKFTVTTNDSGDFMIFGVPVGTQRLVLNVDLSDIGQFSQSPQDLIRLGVATETQVNGTKFDTSENLDSLPQIITLVQDVNVSPLWGDEELCQVSITRADTDLTKAKNIEIKPAAIFMGSIFSDSDKGAIKRKCKPPLVAGSMCSLFAGPGQILAVRQTIKQDPFGRPVLEEYELENNGNVIDDNGTWLLDVPMNLDYIITNEFGEQVFSNDERKGIPTNAKYRFKIKWNQGKDEKKTIRRGSFMVPNVREYGWDNSQDDPFDDKFYVDELETPQTLQFAQIQNPLGIADTQQVQYLDLLPYDGVVRIQSIINVKDLFFTLNGVPIPQKNNIIVEPGDTLTVRVEFKDITPPITVAEILVYIEPFKKYQVERSYAFSLNWDDYADQDAAISCEDTFFKMSYNRVYTVSQLITRFTKGGLNRRYSAIKDITDTECDSTSNKFPTNDAQFKPDFLFILFSILIIFLSILLKIFVKVLHVVLKLLSDILDFLIFIDDAQSLFSLSRPIGNLERLIDGLSGFNLPMYTFPDCELCDCKPPPAAGGFPLGVFSTQQQAPFRNNSVLADILNGSNYDTNIQNGATDFTPLVQTFHAGYFPNNTNYGWLFKTGGNLLFTRVELFDPSQQTTDYYFPTNLPFHERITLQNAKGKFFGSGLDRGKISPPQESTLNQVGFGPEIYYAGGGTNQIKVCFNKNLNNPNLGPDFQLGSNGQYTQTLLVNNLINNYDNQGFHYDSVLILFTEEPYTKGTLLTFDNPKDYRDLNLSGSIINQFGTYSTTGTSINNGISQIRVSHTHPLTGRRLITKYNISGDSSQNQFLRFPTGLEYYQVLYSEKAQKFIDEGFWGGTYDARDDMTSFAYYNRIFTQSTLVGQGRFYSTTAGFGLNFDWSWAYAQSPYVNYQDKGSAYVTILMRGVDPHSTAQPMKIGLGRIFGKQNHWSYTVEGNFKMNIPLQPNDGKDFGELPDDESQGYATDLAHRCTRHNGVGLNNESSNKDNGYTLNRLFFKSYHFKPNQQQWESFNTTSVYNYIRTSEEDYGVNMIAGYPEPIFQSYQPPQSGILRQTSNYYTFVPETNGRGLRTSVNNFYGRTQWQNNDVTLGPPSPVENGVEKRFLWSYQVGEPIEGIPFMCLVGDALDNGLDTSSIALNVLRYLKIQPIYYSRKYNDTTFTMSNAERIVMRSDRMPTSDVYQGIGPNSFGGMANGNFKIYEVPIEGIVTSGSSQPPQLTFQVSEPDEPPAPDELPNQIAQLLDSFTCNSLVPLNCYSPTANGESVQIAPTGTCTYVSFTDRDDNTFNNQFFVEGSCYSLVRPPFNQSDNVKNDRELINEWASRININFGACREVFSHLFVNNWVNGALYAIPFKSKRRFTGPNDVPPNTAFYRLCDQMIYHLPKTTNFYYRSAPYKKFSDGTGNFIGREGNTFLSQPQGNVKNHMYPTTMMNLGPRDELQKFLSQSGEWEGYIMDTLDSTTFGDTSELLNIFVLSRLANTSFTSLFKSRGSSVLNFFDSRKKRFIDADFAQLIATNSQYGVDAYDPESYPEPPPNSNLSSSLYLRTNFGSPKDVVMGIMYDGNEQNRDFISPGRVTYNEEAQIGSPCGYDSFPINSQNVPFYLWRIITNDARSNIFGAQSNDWTFTNYTTGYQSIDRLLPYGDASKVFKPGNNNIIRYNKGWIYNVENIYNEFIEGLDYDPEPGLPADYLMGAPYYFYFGVVKGSSAFDRFAAKWIDTEGLA